MAGAKGAIHGTIDGLHQIIRNSIQMLVSQFEYDSGTVLRLRGMR